jgi:prepilin-type N-terminal cleavage/methylation domain-containing protein
MRSVEPRGPRGGFTLVELLVSLLIGAVLVAVVFQMISGQTRIAAVQAGREEAQQNARGALEIVSSELRSALAQGIVEARPQALTFMQPRAWGLLCAGAAGATFNAVFPNTGGDAAWQPGPGNGVLVQSAAGWVPLPANYPTRAQITNAQVLGAPTAANCPIGAAGNVVVVQLQTSIAPGGAAGDLVALYALTRYELGAGPSGTWLRRSNGMSGNTFSLQPLAGPVDPARFGFTYLGDNGANLGEPGTNAAVLANVRQVRVQVVTNSTQRINDLPQRDSGTAVVTLRN